MPFEFDARDESIRAERLVKWLARKGPRVGDFVKLPNGELRRWAHHWGDSIQPTSSGGGSFYFFGPSMSMSGGLDPAISIDRIRDTGEVQDGVCWFFHHGISGGGRGVYCKVPCRVYEVEGEDSGEAMTGAD